MPTRKSVRPVVSLERVRTSVTNYLQIKSRQKDLSKREATLKEELNGVVDENGATDEKGNIWFDLGEMVEGPDGEKYSGLKRERRKITTFDDEEAEKILKKKGLDKPVEEGGCIVLVPMIDQEEIHKAYFDKKITKAELERMFKTNYNYALYVVKP